MGLPTRRETSLGPGLLPRSLPLLPQWSQAAWLVHWGRGVAARLRFRGSLGRVSTGSSLTLSLLEERMPEEPLSVSGRQAHSNAHRDIQAVPEYSCMTPR
ncbi:hypothetical protein NDU88_002802 [Pleurodeles waltl]|uniref:Uncharacterized protein n=1 Tax=Pleurodeles waltl TaxID=8319 RepID=A0AAV7WM82_PLEWA|nr:hypothetical protein NDU88_002802 [Pleurodeles waltl]